MSLTATCATIGAILAAAQGGETINLKSPEPCAAIRIERTYTRRVTINAGGTTIKGLSVIGGGNIRWRSGRIEAPEGPAGIAMNGYAVTLREASKVAIEGVLVTSARMGIVIDQSRAIRVASVRFWGLRVDGINASRTDGLTVTRSVFSDPAPRPSSCTAADGSVTFAVPRRDCDGTWADGDHPDAIQMRHGVRRANITYNRVDGATQGIAQMDTVNDAPLERVTIAHNVTRTSTYHPISLGPNCIGCVIRDNDVGRADGSTVKAIITPGAAIRCDNVAPDDRTVEQSCAEAMR